jgi:PIN domain nuclease of toxin-antitoxin system
VRLLLDTHAVLWWYTVDRRLGHRVRAEVTSNRSTTWVSAVSVWEAAIKFAAGKLRLSDAPADVLADEALVRVGFRPLSISGAHALKAGVLPPHHGDPFDRMLIAQAQMEDLTIVTSDSVFDDYDVRTLDARS